MAGRTLATGLSEGIVEEGGQGWISSSEKLYALSKWKHTPLSAYMATDFFPEVVETYFIKSGMNFLTSSTYAGQQLVVISFSPAFIRSRNSSASWAVVSSAPSATSITSVKPSLLTAVKSCSMVPAI